MASAQDDAVRHQPIVPDKVPNGDYPVSRSGTLQTWAIWLTAPSSSTTTRMPSRAPSLRRC